MLVQRFTLRTLTGLWVQIVPTLMLKWQLSNQLALTEISKRDYQNIVIIDSQATIRDISSVLLSINESVQSCQLSIKSLTNSSGNVNPQWIPSHCGIMSNDLLTTGQGWF
ncbi:hypothetical protein TNCV_1366401 [Trichonephila clavipes]|nr:hypothetical protein TNCV_1366401 [Trichonephila clavipes]